MNFSQWRAPRICFAATAISKRIGKDSTLIAVLSLLCVGACARWWIFRPGAGWWIMLDPLLGGGALWVAITMVVQSMFADICDEDELASGQRREGIFGAVFSWLIKAGTSLALLATGLVLNWVGFDVSLKANQTPGTILAMRLFLSVAPILAAVACIIYPVEELSPHPGTGRGSPATTGSTSRYRLIVPYLIQPILSRSSHNLESCQK